jgi:NADH-quinone oxidoreductase subunit L
VTLVSHPDQSVSAALGLLPLVPLIGAVISYSLGGGARRDHWMSGWLSSIFAIASFVITLELIVQLGDGGAIIFNAWKWIAVDRLQVDIALRFDRLAAVMCMIVTGVGSLIHIYAIGYMAKDPDRPRFFAYLNLFLFAMLMLVLGDSLPVMFVGWEGVGLCSYLLIGFWFKEMPNAVAGQKAFVVNRIGDAGFLLGMFTLFFFANALSFPQIARAVTSEHPLLPAGVIEAAAILLFVGAIGKSAQIPLHVWLPDAMAGPTPVSALIHAATMVTAGVYMIARLSPLYSHAPIASLIISIIGTLTAFFAATVALVQNDIKKVLAYSTVSQLGFMFMAMGAGAFSAGIYHVTTHAFFKGCLFLAAGSVIMGCHHEQDLRRLGGLARKMPITAAAYLFATLAISGIPFTSGFFSKDAILWSVYSSDGLASQIFLYKHFSLKHILISIGLVTTFLTAFYMTRSFVLTFFGAYRGHAHPNESPFIVWGPVAALALLSLIFGICCHETFRMYLLEWSRADMRTDYEHTRTFHLIEYSSSALAILGLGLGILVFDIRQSIASFARMQLSSLYYLLVNNWCVDDIYARVVVAPLSATATFLFTYVDCVVIDRSVNGIGSFVKTCGACVRRLQEGRLSYYALMMYCFSVAITVYWIMGVPGK